MLVKVQVLAEGQGPSETLIGVPTSDGHIEQVIVSKRVLHGDAIEVGRGLSYDGNRILIELPRESTSGKWRVWINESQVEHKLQAAE